MSKNKEENSIPVEIKDDSSEALNSEHDEQQENEHTNYNVDELKELLLEERKKSQDFEDKLKHTLADFQNLQRKIQSDIETESNNRFDKFMLDFLQIYDDFIRAKNAFESQGIDAKGLDSVIKNLDSLLSKYHISSIDALGEIFDPKLHEAISIVEDPSLDDDTITKELRKGYISHNRVIRPTLVEISKKSK